MHDETFKMNIFELWLSTFHKRRDAFSCRECANGMEFDLIILQFFLGDALHKIQTF